MGLDSWRWLKPSSDPRVRNIPPMYYLKAIISDSAGVLTDNLPAHHRMFEWALKEQI